MSGANATPGVPIAWEDPSNPENAQPGYGYVAYDTTGIGGDLFIIIVTTLAQQAM